MVTRPRGAVVVRITVTQETDGRFLAESANFAGVMAYGATAGEAAQATYDLERRVVEERIANGEPIP